MLGNRLRFEGPILNMTTMNCMSYIGSMCLAFCHFYLASSKVMPGNARERGGIRSGNVAGQIWTCTISTTLQCVRACTNFQLPVIFDPFFNVDREGNSHSKSRGHTNTFPHVTLSKSKEGPAQNCSFLVWTASSTQVLCRLMAEPQRNMELPETRVPCVKPSCHLLVPEIRVSYHFCRVAIRSVISPNALLWVMDVTGQKKKSFHSHANSNERKRLSLDNSHVQKQLRTFLRIWVKAPTKNEWNLWQTRGDAVHCPGQSVDWTSTVYQVHGHLILKSHNCILTPSAGWKTIPGVAVAWLHVTKHSPLNP